MKKLKLLTLTLLLTCVFSIGVNAQTNDRIQKEYTLGNTIINSTRSTEDDPLSYMNDTLSKTDDYLLIYCNTVSIYTCDSIELSIYLQKKVNGYWSTVKTYNCSNSNQSSLSITKQYRNYSSNSEYRLKVYHYATYNDKTYIQSSTTSTLTTD
ncbi:MAG: hypothetical protein N4A63_07800 [Vallitalea sp.]|jgi:hypothetical protein|nr:hypothetical protein [Vallitalea sp.]